MAEEIFEMDEAAQEYHEDKDQYKYIAFISYRHLEPDIQVAKAIHTMIETFKLPKEFYENGEKPQFRVFRDREELSTSSLSESIQDALQHSKFLIVVCSKRFNDSAWCRKEVQTFIKLHGIHRVIPVLIEGEPEESFPQALLPDPSAENLDEETEAKDILAAELRSDQVKNPAFPGFANLEKSDPASLKKLGDLAVKCLKNEKYRIMATILGVSFGDLKQRDKVRRQRQLMLLSAIISVSLLVFGIFMFNAYRNENQAKRQTMQDKAHFMLEEADSLIKEGNRYKALMLAENAMKDLDASMPSYNDLKDKHLQILNETVAGSQAGYNRVIETGNEFTFLDINPQNNTFVAGLNNDSIALYDVATGNLLKTAMGHTQQVKILTFSNKGDQLVSGGFDGVINLWQADNLDLILSTTVSGNIMLAEFTHEDKYLEVIYDTSEGYICQRYDAKTLKEDGQAIQLNPKVHKVYFDKTGYFMWVNYLTYQENQSLIKYDLTKREEAEGYDDFVKDGQRYHYADVKSSGDHQSIYTKVSEDLVKIDLATNQVLFHAEGFYKAALGNLVVASSENGEALYVAENININKVDPQTGQILLEISTGVPGVKQMQVSQDGKNLLVLKENSDLVFISDDRVVSSIPNTSKSSIDYIFLTPDGHNALTLSLQNQEIKLLSLQSASEKEMKDGQIVNASDDGNYCLIYEDKQFYFLDANANKIVKKIENEELTQNLGYIPRNTGYILSNDGKYLTYLLEREIGKSKVSVWDIENSKTHMIIDVDKDSFQIGFRPDSSQLFITTGNGQITFYDLKSKKESDQLSIDKGFLDHLFITDDGGYFIVQYSESISKVYDLKTKEKVAEIPGSIISMELG